MPTPNELRSEINRFARFLMDNEAALTINSTVNQAGRVEWPRTRGMIRERFGTIQHYLDLIRSSDFTWLMSDGGIFQLSYGFERGRLRRHRLSFVPCPVAISESDAEEITEFGFLDLVISRLELAIDHEGGMLGAVAKASMDPPSGQDDTAEKTEVYAGATHRLGFLMRPAVRFDYDEQGQQPNHPASHIHLTDAECRWAVAGPVGVGEFVRFVFRHFYPTVWKQLQVLRDWPFRDYNRTITAEEETELFVERKRPLSPSTRLR